ncbi:hypothetical protein [Sphingomonas changnyeongensis]|nr:hypothetical protein [Sphingomonas changnyeongensis]
MAAPEGGLQILFEARDPLLDAMAFSRGRFVLQGAGRNWCCRPGPNCRAQSRIAGPAAGDEQSSHKYFCASLDRCDSGHLDSGCEPAGSLWLQQAKGGDPMSHGSAERSVKSVRELRA